MKFKPVLALLLVAVTLTVMFSGAPSAQAYSTRNEEDGVVMLGDFKSITSGYLVLYPAALDSGSEKYPIVTWANGTGCLPFEYMSLLKTIAKAGYVVVTSSEMMSADGKAQVEAIDYLFSDDCEIPDEKLDGDHIAAVGHSQGGRSSVNAAVLSDKIDCVVSIAGSNYTSEAKKLSTPTLFLTGTLDTVVMSKLWVYPAYNKCTGPAVYASLKGGIHTTCMLDPELYESFDLNRLYAIIDNTDTVLIPTTTLTSSFFMGASPSSIVK